MKRRERNLGQFEREKEREGERERERDDRTRTTIASLPPLISPFVIIVQWYIWICRLIATIFITEKLDLDKLLCYPTHIQVYPIYLFTIHS